MARLPQPGGDQGTWGSILNDFLSTSHKSDGSLLDNIISTSMIQDNAVTEVKLSAAVQTKLNAVGSGGGDPSLGGDLSGTASAAVIVADAVNTGKIVDNAITTSKVNDGAISEAKLDSSVQAKLNAPGSSTPADGSLTPAKLNSDVPAAGELLSYNGTGFEWITAPAAGGGGEANTASNVGSTGVGVYKQKTGVNIELKNIAAGSNKVTVTNNTANNTVDIGVVEGNFALTKSMVGLANVDNTSDVNKPVSTATQTALNAKATDSAVIHTTGAETVAGVKTFSSSPIVPTPTTNTQAANKSYVDGVVSAGAPDATTTTNGVVRLAGDLAGTAAAPSVAKVKGITISATAPTTGQVLTATSATAAAWATPSGGGGGGYSFTFVSQTSASYTAVNFNAILANSSSNSITITLPAPVANGLVRVKRLNTAGNGIMVVPPSGSFIDDNTVGSDTLNNQYDSRDYWSDGNNWYR